MDAVETLLGAVSEAVWGPAMLALILGTGIFLSIGLRFMPVRRIPAAFRLMVKGRRAGADEPGEITPYQTLMTALAATVGTGNIAGVATAIAFGGPGAVFWMWMTALVGMATKYAEAVLAMRYREVDKAGRYVGGPMYYIKNGMGPRWAWLGWLFALFTMIAGFGIGNMVQAHSLADVFNETTQIPRPVIGAVLAALIFVVIIGGLKRIAAWSDKIVPVMALIYVLGALAIIGANVTEVPGAFALIFQDAFTPSAATGGFAGAAVWAGLRYGVARGVFSNEAGLGSAAIAHAAAQTKDPAKLGMVAMLGTFIDTIIVCTMTALVILTVPLETPAEVTLVERASAAGESTVMVCPTPAEEARIAKGEMTAQTVTVERPWHTCRRGATLSSYAFANGLPGGEWVVTIGLVLFVFSTLLGWSYYGERAAEYLFGEKIITPYRVAWVAAVYVGATQSLATVWTFADIMNGLMAIPNLVALLALSGTVFALSRGVSGKGD